MERIQDAEVVARALAGSEEAYAELVRRYQRPLWSLILRMVRDEAVAEDLAQEAFLKAFDALASYDPRRRFSSWLFKIAHNATLDHLRRRRPATVPLDPEDDDERGLAEVLADPDARDPEREAAGSDLGRAIEAAVGRLRPEYREVVLLRFAEGLPYAEIAEVTGMPEGTVKTFIHRARKQLAKLLGEAGWRP